MTRERTRRALRRAAAALVLATNRWMAPRTSLFAAALAFYALLSLAPTLLVVLSIGGRLLGEESARASLAEMAVRLGGPGADRVAEALVGLMPEARWQAGTLLGVALLLFFASSFFNQLRAALNTIWEVRGIGFGRALFDRLVSFGETIVGICGVVLILAVGMLRSIVRPFLARTETATLAWSIWTRAGTLLMLVLVLWVGYRYIPNVRPLPRRAAVAAGALVAAVILHIATDFFATIIGRSAVVSLYGAAGSMIMFLLWVYYSAWIALLGAEICRAWDGRDAGASGPEGQRATSDSQAVPTVR